MPPEGVLMGDRAVHSLGHTEDRGTNQSGGSGSPKPSGPQHQWDKDGARAWWPGAQDGQKAVIPGEDSRRVEWGAWSPVSWVRAHSKHTEIT